MNNRESEENIKLLCSITEKEKALFTFRQLELIILLKKGLKTPDLTKAMSCSKQNVSAMIKYCVKIIEKSRSAPEQPPKKLSSQPSEPRKQRRGRKPIIDYAKYKDRDLSTLSSRQREVLEYKINSPQMTVKKIADQIGISDGAAGSYLQIAIQKLEGTYDKTRESKRKYYQKNPEKTKEYKHNYWLQNKGRMSPRMRETHRKYYLEHREEIMEKQRLRRKGENKK